MYTGFFGKNLVSMIDIYIEFVLQEEFHETNAVAKFR